ncbi:hypothetical protein A0H81_08913 [Grifola frondosa]|uniref:RRM domain-containing protein n=1 Tax=Grifola frondosa TaxID=5627 RepID=A0A1C7M524_GRIFR|nr:hypothetical protein A0H81_08913 [Grifola frondosa]
MLAGLFLAQSRSALRRLRPIRTECIWNMHSTGVGRLLQLTTIRSFSDTGSRWEDQSDVEESIQPSQNQRKKEKPTLFVSNLPLSTTEAQVRELFAEYGGAYIRLRGVGYASAAFRSAEVARQALDDSKKKPLVLAN